MFRFLVRILEEETGEEIDDFHNMGFRLANVEQDYFHNLQLFMEGW